MDKKCERCLNKKAIFNCPSCDKYHNVCESCDNFIHILNKTKYHKRQYIYSNSNIEDNNEKNDYNFSKNYFSNNNQDNATSSLSRNQNLYKINYNNNEINISSIKEQIENVQKNMSNQINKILLNIDNYNPNLNYDKKLKELENNYKEKINNLIYEKNKEIKDLELEMNMENSINQKIINEISEKNKDNNNEIIELTNIVNSLTDELNRKEEEIIKIKNNKNRRKKENNIEIEKEKERISKNYEKKINNIINISEHNQQKLKNVIKDKEIIIQNLINCNKNKTEQFNIFVNKLEKDNNALKNIAQKSIGLAKYNLINQINN